HQYEARKLRSSVHHLSVQYELLKHENEGLKEALQHKKKHRKKGKALDLQQRQEYHGGSVFWSPRKLREARAREAVRERDETEEKLQKARSKKQREEARLQRQDELEERRTPAAINVPAPPNNELTIDALLDNIKAAYKDDKVLQAIVKAKKDGLRRLPFKLIHGEEHLRLELGDCEITDELLYVRNKVYVPAGAVRTQVIEQAHKSDELRASMQWAQAKQAEYANEGRLPAPAFKVGDQVMLDTRNLRTKRPSASLDLKNRGPFTIVRAINNTAYELDLPANMKRIHNVFHPWLLHLVDDNPLTGQTQDPEVPAEFDPEVEDDTEYTVEAIEDCRINKKLKDPAARGRKGKTTQGLLQYL
ncbi:hypothetical protein PtrEW7m1_011820, partial [Pyrenophora tritici-repentis]